MSRITRVRITPLALAAGPGARAPVIPPHTPVDGTSRAAGEAQGAHGAALAVGERRNRTAVASERKEQGRVQTPTGRVSVPRRPVDELGQEDGDIGASGASGVVISQARKASSLGAYGTAGVFTAGGSSTVNWVDRMPSPATSSRRSRRRQGAISAARHPEGRERVKLAPVPDWGDEIA